MIENLANGITEQPMNDSRTKGNVLPGNSQVMVMPQYKIAALTSEWPSNLKTLPEAATELGIGEQRLADLADGGYAPHMRIDGGPPLFKISELKRWAVANLMQRYDGRDMPAPIRVIAEAPRVSDFRKVPASCREIIGLCDITDEIMRTGIYFLCRDNALLYIGQSVNTHQRITEHYRRYEFDTVLFLPWPTDGLNSLEAALIRALRPPLNGKGAAGTMRTSSGDNSTDASIIAQITNPTTTSGIIES